MNEQELLQQIREAYQTILKENLVGIYVHGSLAFGCYHPARSDIDFLVVVHTPLTQAEKEALLTVLLHLDDAAPPKGFEMSVVLDSVCSPFVWPTPYELHFSNAHKARCRQDPAGYCSTACGTDPDLAAHFTVTRAVGYALCGRAVEEVFAPVPRQHYIHSLLLDIRSAEMNIEANPVYCTLNLCRVLAFLQEGAVLSKQQGGDWGLRALPARWHPLLHEALAQYSGAAHDPAAQSLRDFAREMLTQIDAALPRCRWCNPSNSHYVNYHDHEWGVPVHDDRRLFELLILEGFQAGLSWECILNKREAFRAAFDGFDPGTVSRYDAAKVEALMQDKGIVRNRRKITAAIGNAAVFLQIQSEYGSFDAFLRQFTGGMVIVENDKTTSPLSDRVSADLKRRGMRFVGSTIIYSYLQAVGVIDSHEDNCWLSPVQFATTV